MSLAVKRDQLASSLSYANQCLTEVEQKLSFFRVENRALAATVDLEASEIGTLKAGDDVLENLLVDHDAGCGTYWKLQKSRFVITELHLQYF